MEDSSALLAAKAAVISTTGSQGWGVIRRFAERVVVDMERAAIDEESDDKAVGMRREARAARKFFTDLMYRIEMLRCVGEPVADDQFLDLACD